MNDLDRRSAFTLGVASFAMFGSRDVVRAAAIRAE